MSFFSLDNFSNVLAVIYLCAVLLIGMISLITFKVFFNNAEKRVVASSIAVLYLVLFTLFTVIGFSILTST